MRKLFRFNVTKDTGIAAVAGIIALAVKNRKKKEGGVKDNVKVQKTRKATTKK